MKKTLLTIGLSTAVIFGLQAQQVPTETEQEEQNPQEEIIEARGESEKETYKSEKKGEDSRAKTSFSSNDMAQVDKADLPEEVMESFKSSDFKAGTVERIYEINGAAVPQILESRANLSIYAGEQLPETLYIMHVNLDDGKGILYFGDDGESIASEKVDSDDSFGLFENEEDTENATYETEETTTEEIEEGSEEAKETAKQAAYKTEETVGSTAKTTKNETSAKADERTKKIEEEFENKETISAANTANTEESEISAEANTKKSKVSAKADERTKKMEEEFESKEMALVDVSDLPENVTESFENSDWSNGTIYKAYEFDGAVVSNVLEERAELTIYPGEQLPETLYLLQVEHNDGLSFMYVGDDGEVYASEDL